jgi:hypothetical protein
MRSGILPSPLLRSVLWGRWIVYPYLGATNDHTLCYTNCRAWMVRGIVDSSSIIRDDSWRYGATCDTEDARGQGWPGAKTSLPQCAGVRYPSHFGSVAYYSSMQVGN